MQRKKRKGFTLIELVVVLVIVGILSVIAVPMYRGYVRRAMAAEGRALVGSIATSERVYYAEHGLYKAVAAASTNNATLAVDSRMNTYFPSYGVAVNAAQDEFTASSSGTGDANGITVSLHQTTTAAPTVTVTGI